MSVKHFMVIVYNILHTHNNICDMSILPIFRISKKAGRSI